MILPNEIIYKILLYLDIEDLILIRLLNKKIYILINILIKKKIIKTKYIELIKDNKYRIYINEKLNNNFYNIYIKHINNLKNFIFINNIDKHVIFIKYDNMFTNGGIKNNIKESFNILEKNLDRYINVAIIGKDFIDYFEIILYEKKNKLLY